MKKSVVCLAVTLLGTINAVQANALSDAWKKTLKDAQGKKAEQPIQASQAPQANPPANSVSAPLTAKSNEAQASAESVTGSAIQPLSLQQLVGKTFPSGKLPYRDFGFEPFDDKLDRFQWVEMPEGKVSVFPVRKGSDRHVLIAAFAKDEKMRVVDIRPVANSVAKLTFVSSTGDGGDGGTDCTLNGKPVKQVFGYAKRGKKNTYTGQPASDGESMWIVQPGGVRVAPLQNGEKLVCTDWVF